MGLSATDVTPTIRVIICFIFMSQVRSRPASLPLRVREILRCYVRVMFDPSFEIDEWMIAVYGLKRRMRGQIFFNRRDQLGNADRLGEKRMSLDTQASLCLSFRNQRSEKDDRRAV